MACRSNGRARGDSEPGQHRPGQRRVSDDELIRQAQSGSEEAFEQLFQRHWHYACCVAYQWNSPSWAVAEDVAQESMHHAFRSIGKFHLGGNKFRTWLYGIIRHNSNTVRKHRQVTERAVESFRPCRSRCQLDPARNFAAEAMEEAAWQRLQELRPRVQAAFTLHRLEGKGLEEVAGILGCSVSSAWRYCHEAMSEMRRRAGERRRELSV